MTAWTKAAVLSCALSLLMKGEGARADVRGALRAEPSEVILPVCEPFEPLSQLEAVHWELSERSASLSAQQREETAYTIWLEAKRAGMDPLLLVALVQVESSFNHLATSPVGAQGLMQLMPATAEEVAQKEKLRWPGKSFEPTLNVVLGTRYLAYLAKRFSNWEHALTAYNRGPGNTNKILARYRRLPLRVTKSYSDKVLRVYRKLTRIYGDLPYA